MKNFIILLIISISSFSIFAQKSEIKIKISGIDQNTGNIYIALFDENNKESFVKNTEKSKARKIIKVADNKAYTSFKNINYGNYAISVFHDKNNNAQLDRNKSGIPTEAFGFYKNYSAIGLPKFENCMFTVDSSIVEIEIILKNIGKKKYPN